MPVARHAPTRDLLSLRIRKQSPGVFVIDHRPDSAGMRTNTKVLFGAILKARGADCFCDIGSRDGVQALLFRHLRPSAAIFAFEANPINFKAMSQNARLSQESIRLFPCAISSSNGMARFHITDVDYDDPEANIGTSSLLVREDLKIKDTVEVPTRRIDELLLEEAPEAGQIGLWIDVEGAEYEVLSGMEKIKDRVVAIHVETALKPIRAGQRTLSDLEELLAPWGFVPCGSNLAPGSDWGDVVFVNRTAIRGLGWRYRICQLKGYFGIIMAADHFAVALKTRWPAAYRLLRRAYIRLGM